VLVQIVLVSVNNEAPNQTGRASPPGHRLELDAKHELQLPRQASPRVWRSGVVIVVIEIVCRRDLSEIARRLKYPSTAV
jgi:hypothetical protein